MCGIYKITNTINGNCYIGQSVNIQERWKHHRYPSRGSSHYPLYLAFDKYGIDKFTFEVIEECRPEELDEKEIFYIEKFDSYNHGYNQTKGGSAGGHIVKLSEEDITIIYDLLANSSMPQKDIAQMFGVGEDTISEINQGKTRIKEGFNYPLRNNRADKCYCIDCGKEIHKGAIRCASCKSKSERRVERPSREELKNLIRTTSFTKIAEKYGVSDNSIRKWCDAEGLPRKVKDIKALSELEWLNI